MEPQAADRCTIRIDGDEAAGDIGQGGAGPGIAGPRRRDEPDPDRLDDLVEECPRIAAALLEAVEDVHARRRIAGQERRDEPVDGRRIGEAQQVADVRCGDGLGGHRQQLVEDRFRVAHPAGGGARDEGHGLGLELAAVRFQDPLQLALDLGRRESPDVVALEARQDGGRESGWLGRGEHEDDEVGWLLERLEQGVPGVAGDLVGLVEDVHLAT